MKCEICFNQDDKDKWITTARKYSARVLTGRPAEALSKRITEWRPIDILGDVPGRNHKYRCPSCKSSKCGGKGGSGCNYYGEWIKSKVINSE